MQTHEVETGVSGSASTFAVHEFHDFFYSRQRNCTGCEKSVSDLWAAASDYMQNDRSADHPFELFALLGYKARMFTVVIYPCQSTKVDFTDYSVPEEAIIIGVQYAATDGLLSPMELSGWIKPHYAEYAFNLNADGTYSVPPALSRYSKRLYIPHEMEIFGAEIDPGPATATRVQVVVRWLEPDEAETVADLMFWAFEAFVMDRLGSAMMLAQIVRETKIKQIGEGHKLLLEDLIQIADEMGAPHLRHDIHELLELMRTQRNEFVHDRRRLSLTRSTVADYLCATVFLVHYINLLMNSKCPEDKAR